MGALVNRFNLSLLTQRISHDKRASLHTGIPPTEANRITEAGWVYETKGRGTSFWQVADSTPGVAIRSAAASRIYSELDFTQAGANPSAPPVGTRIRALAFWYASRLAEAGEDRAALPYDLIGWSSLDQPWPAAAKLLRFLQPGSANRDDDFPAPYIQEHIPSFAGRGGQWVSGTVPPGDGSFGQFGSSFLRIFTGIETVSLFNANRARRSNCDLIFSDTLAGPAHADWPAIPFGLVSRFFLYGGGSSEEDALDLINIGQIEAPAASADRTLPKYYQVRLASSGGRGVRSGLQGKHLFWGMLGRCRDVVDEPDPGRAVEAGKRVVIPVGGLCVPLWARYRSDDPYYFSPEPAAPLGLRVDASDPAAIRLSWEPVPDAKAYLVELTDDLTWATRDSECVVFLPQETFYSLPSRPWAARVRATNDGGAGPWSDGVQFTPGEAPAGVSNLAVVSTSPSSITWGWDTPAGTTTCEVEWQGPTSGSVEVSRGEQSLWRHTVGSLETGTVVSLRARARGPDGVWSLWSDWVPGTSGVGPGDLPAPTNVRADVRYSNRVDIVWDMPPGLTRSQIRLRVGTETVYRAPHPVAEIGGFSRQWVAAEPDTPIVAQVRSAVDWDDGPYSEWVPDPALVTRTRPLATKPETITDLTAMGGIGHVLFAWSQPEGIFYAHVEWTEQAAGAAAPGPVRLASLGNEGERAIYAPRGTTIRARVRASRTPNTNNPADEHIGAWSAWVSGVVAANIPIPTGLSATGGAGTVRFEWMLPAGIETAEVAVQKVNRIGDLGGGTTGGRATAPVRHLVVSASPNRYVRGRVRSITPDGHTSAWSDWTEYVQATAQRDPGGDPGEVPAVPSLEVDTTINSLEATIGIAAGATSYERSLLKADGTWTAPVSTERAFTVEADGDGLPLEGGESYGLRVRARNAIGASAWRTGSYTTVLPIPRTPEVSRTPTHNSVEFTASEEDYATRVEYQREGATGWPVAWSTAPTNTWTVEDLSPSTRYRYRFRSCNSSGCSNPVTLSFFTLEQPSGPPPAPKVPDRVPSVTTSGETASSFRVTYGAARHATTHERRFKKRSETWAGKAWKRVSGSSGGTFTLSDLDASTTYDVEVRGRSTAGAGQSRAASATTEAEPATCPTDRAEATFTKTSSTATITITPPARATRTQLRWKRAGSTYSYTVWENVSTPHTIRSLSADTDYEVDVRGWNAACGTTGSGPIRTLAIRTDAAASCPITSAPSPSWESTDSSLAFTVAALACAVRFQYNWQGQSAWYNFQGRTLNVQRVRAGYGYTIRFRGVNAAIVPGPASSYITGWTNPGQATASLTSRTTSVLNITIGAGLTGVTGYQRKVATTAAGLASARWSRTFTSRSFSLSNLAPGTTRHVQVRAVGQGGSGAASAAYSWTTAVAVAPAAPTVNGTFLNLSAGRWIRAQVTASYRFDWVRVEYEVTGKVARKTYTTSVLPTQAALVTLQAFSYATGDRLRTRAQVRRASDSVWSEWSGYDASVAP